MEYQPHLAEDHWGSVGTGVTIRTVSLEEPVTIHVQDGDVVADQSWVYVWVRSEDDRRVIYVGATGMHPETRVWLHLHHEDPEVGRVLARYPDANRERLEVFAFRVPESISRQTVRAAVTARLNQDHLLSKKYCGDPPAEVESTTEAAGLLEAVASAVARHVVG